MNWKSMALKITAAVLTGAMVLQQPLQLIAQAAQTPEYLSEVIISYGNSDEEAKKWLTENGYQIIDQNLNQDAEGGAEWMSWAGLASEKRSVYLGYKTTNNASEAITDMKIMNMNGGYSYQAYEQVLEEIKKEKEHFLNNMQKALDEYRENYQKGAAKAKVAHDNLNKFYDDDTGQYMGDLLLNTMKTEDEAAWEKDPKNHADMVTILMQGNSTVVSEIMQNLAFASDTAEDSWLDRALATQNVTKPEGYVTEADLVEDEEFNSEDETEDAETEANSNDIVYATNGFEAMLYQYEAKYGYDEETLAKRLVAEYDDDAKMFASSLVGLSNFLTNYTKSDLSKDATAEEAEAYFEEHPFESQTLYTEAYTLFESLTNTSYENISLMNYFITDEYDFMNNEAYLEGYEDECIPQRALLYPFVASMSDGQRALLEYTAMNRLLTIGMMEDDTWETLEENLKNTEYGVDSLEPCSVYADIDRDNFKVGNVAVTNVAQGLQASTGEAPDNGVFGSGVSYVTAGIGVGGVAIGVAGIVIAAKNAGDPAKISGGMMAGLMNDGAKVAKKNVAELEQAIKEHMAASQMLLKNGFDSKTIMNNVELNSHRLMLTAPGPNGEIVSFAANMIENTDGSITLANGLRIAQDGSQTIDTSVQGSYRHFLETINPDLKATNAALNETLKQSLERAKDSLERMKNDLLTIQIEVGKDRFVLFFHDIDFDVNKLLYGKDAFSPEILAQLSDEDLNTVIERIRDADFYNGRALDNLAQCKEILKNIDDYENQYIANGVPKDTKTFREQEQQAQQFMTEGSGSKFWQYFGVGMAIVGFAMAVYSGYRAWDEMNEYYHTEMLPIPKMMVDRGTNATGDSCYIYYNCVPCNRASVGMANDTLGDCGDLNGDVMKQWLALYTTKDVHAGNPIPAKFEVKVGTTDLPVGYLPLTFFGFGSAVNMVDEDYVYNNSVGGIYLYYAENTAPVLTGSPDSTASDPGTNTTTGTVTSTNSLVATGALSAVGGAAACAGIMTFFKRKKKETAA